MSEALIAYHCAPALAGIKPSNIVSWQKSKIPDIHSEIKKLNNQLNCKEIYLDIICECENYALIMVYRKNVLEKHLQNRQNVAFLSKYGYSENASIEEHISFLKTRLKHDCFPHEIGVFLGYPLRDIYGFINHRDEGCILIGEWKVYHNADRAEQVFARYKACRAALLKRVKSGRSLAQIFCTA